jgi:hypothetical protein
MKPPSNNLLVFLLPFLSALPPCAVALADIEMTGLPGQKPGEPTGGIPKCKMKEIQSCKSNKQS